MSFHKTQDGIAVSAIMEHLKLSNVQAKQNEIMKGVLELPEYANMQLAYKLISEFDIQTSADVTAVLDTLVTNQPELFDATTPNVKHEEVAPTFEDTFSEAPINEGHI